MELREIRQLAEEVLEQTGLSDLGWRFEFDRAKSRGGACHYRTKSISLSALTAPKWSRDQVLDAIRHEAGHALVGAGHGHDRVWVSAVLSLGGSANRTHHNETVEYRYRAHCERCDTVVGGRHRLTRGMRAGAVHPRCGGGKILWIDTALETV